VNIAFSTLRQIGVKRESDSEVLGFCEQDNIFKMRNRILGRQIVAWLKI
jgi:hypothetical protein